MAREVDCRDHSVSKAIGAREARLRSLASAVSDRLPGAHRVRVERLDATTGNPAVVTSQSAPAETGNYVQRALDHVRMISQALGLTATQPVEFVADPVAQKTSSGAVSVHLHQCYKGVPIFEAAETVRFAPNGMLKETVGSSVTVAQEVAVSPRINVDEAVLKAAQHIAEPHSDEKGAKDPFGQSLELPSVDITGFEPQVITSFPEKPDRPTVLEGGPFGDKIKASLIWFPRDEALRLAWDVRAAMPDYVEQYRTLVDADTGEILYCRQLVQFVDARGNVFHVDGGSPRQTIDFPRPLTDYGLPVPGDLPPGFPDDWVAVNRTVGNGVNAHLGTHGPSSKGSVQAGLLTFDPSQPTGDDQKVLNIFYYNCFMHDYFYLLGFREADGNFQRDNFGRGGLRFDRVDARAHSGAVFGTANMSTPIDGLNPEMNMGLVVSTQRHTAFDSSVVFHEFTHGVTNRLVGGPAKDRALDAHQRSGMGEGWSDYIACTINERIVVGDWVVDDPGGIRGFPYDSNFPDDFGDLGTGRYNGSAPHPIGEIWCATLLEMNRNIGANLGVQLVVDALKLTPASPSFLVARDAILAALDDMLEGGRLSPDEHETARRGIWQAFAKFGMGPNAQSNGASLSGIVADFNTPPEEPVEPEPDVRLETLPDLAIPDLDPVGVTSVLTVAQAGRIARLTVSVDIEHTFIGDLRVSLTTPTGSHSVLHNRSGASANDLIKSYSSDDTTALEALLGEEAQGDWTLPVIDLAGLDTGTLRRWRLDIDLETATDSVREEAAPRVTIPDNDPTGVNSSINIAGSGTAQRIRVDVDITHTFIGDLRVVVVAPSGERAVLHDQFGGSEDNLIRTFDSTSNPALAALAGQQIQGSWVLRVADLLGQDIGKFNKWSLELTL